MTFNDFCRDCCDGLYDPRLPEDSQCTGYRMLKKLVVDSKHMAPPFSAGPVSADNAERWRGNPTAAELASPPDIKYLQFLHPLLRPLIINNWNKIRTLKI